MQRVFFDITNLRMYIEHGRRLSGIQRVTVMLIEHTVRQIGREKVYLSFHNEDTGDYSTVPCKEITDILSGSALAAALHRKNTTTNVRPTLERYSRKPIKRRIHTIIRNINAASKNHKHFEKRKSTLEAWLASANKSTSNSVSNQSKGGFLDFFKVAQPGDHVVIADAAWTLPTKHMKRANSQGILCNILVHDLIQIKAPELIGGTQQSFIFHDWLLDTMEYVSSYLANSHSTASDLKEFLNTYGGKQRVDVVPLASAGIPVSNAVSEQQPSSATVNSGVYPRLSGSGHINDHIRSLLRRPYVLCVGTMEVRKNMWGLVQAWERLRLRDDIELPRLVFAGNRGWLNHDFERLMSATGNLYGWVELVSGPSDEELDFLYKNCLFTAMPSFLEGWGLPVGESLSYGKTAVVSETSSLPEVGGDLVLYFDPHSISSITASVYRMLSKDGLREELESRIAATSLRDWSDVARDVLAAID